MEKYKLIENTCRYMVEVHNKRYKALRDKNMDLYNQALEVECKIVYFIESLGCKLEYSYDINYPMVAYKGETVFKLTNVNFQKKAI